MTTEKFVIIANELKESDTVTTLTYQAVGGDETIVKVPTVALTTLEIEKGEILCRISQFQTSGGTFRPSLVFREGRTPIPPTKPLHIDLIDMVQQGAAEENLKARIGEEKSGPVVATVELETHQPAVAMTPNPLSGAWDGVLLSGGRESKVAPWNFVPEFLPNFVFIEDEKGTPVARRINKSNGGAVSWSVLNPALRSEKRPAGALLGSVSDRYHVLPHPEWVNPMLKYAEMSGIQASVTAWADGARCRLDLDVTQASQTRKAAASIMKERGHAYLNVDSTDKMARSLDSLYKYGFVINNSLDGRSSFSVHGAALRVYCQNLAVIGGIKTALSLRHTKGVMAEIDWDALSLDLVNATADLNEWLINTELLSWVPMDIQLMDKMMGVMAEHNIGLSPPRKIKDKESQEVKAINRNHMDLALTQGWKQPSIHYVNVDEEQRETAYHALQCFTGTMTHKPTVFDDKRKLDGTALNIHTLDSRLKKVNDEFMGLLHSTLGEVLEGGEVDLSDRESVKETIQRENLVEAYFGDTLGYTEVHGISAL